jgi:hypothetical protein
MAARPRSGSTGTFHFRTSRTASREMLFPEGANFYVKEGILSIMTSCYIG